MLPGRRMLVCGTPAPVASRAALAQPTEPFLTMVRDFNAALAAAARTRAMPYLDAYALTAAADGTANGRWHLDDFHLVPEALAALL